MQNHQLKIWCLMAQHQQISCQGAWHCSFKEFTSDKQEVVNGFFTIEIFLFRLSVTADLSTGFDCSLGDSSYRQQDFSTIFSAIKKCRMKRPRHIDRQRCHPIFETHGRVDDLDLQAAALSWFQVLGNVVPELLRGL